MSKHAVALPTVAAGQSQQLAGSFDLILLENSLLILGRGVLEGRRVFGNIIKKIPFIHSRASWLLIVTSIIIVAVGAWLTVSPLAGTLGFVALPPLYWLLLGDMILTQGVETWFFRRFGE